MREEVIYMQSRKKETKRVCVTLTVEDYEKLSLLALNTNRTVPGYLRWLLHRDFRARSGR